MGKFLLSTLYFLLSTVLIACAPTRLAIKTGYDFSQIKIIGVSEFGGEGESGKIVQEEFIRQFLKKGLIVKEVGKETKPEREIDILVTGAVTRYLPERKFLVYLGEGTTDQKIIIYPSLTEISGTYGYAWGRIAGLEGSQILVTNATIGIAAKMVDPKSGEVIWADSYTYEGLDIQTATGNVVRYFLHSLRKYWKELY
jgi:hypothetical protein